MSRRPAVILAVAAVVIVALGVIAGRSLRPESGAAYSFDASAPAFETVQSAGTSKAGFTGFTEGADARTVISGRVVSATDTAITLQRPDGSTTVLRVTPQSPFRRIEASDRAAIRTGAQVLVRRSGDDAVAILVLAPQ
jgi:hypothetical protein